MKITLNPFRRKKGMTLIELLMLAALLALIIAGIIKVSIEAFRALERLLNQRNEEIRRIQEGDENGDRERGTPPTTFYRHTAAGWTV
jgi:type II secretory pathway pseudopilin PulG